MNIRFYAYEYVNLKQYIFLFKKKKDIFCRTLVNILSIYFWVHIYGFFICFLFMNIYFLVCLKKDLELYEYYILVLNYAYFFEHITVIDVTTRRSQVKPLNSQDILKIFKWENDLFYTHFILISVLLLAIYVILYIL